jgi:segregation and condensation protein A
MENGFPLASGGQRSYAINVPSKPNRNPEKVVLISSHPGWRHVDQTVGEEVAADTVDMVRIFHEVLERVRCAPVLNMDDESVTVGQMIDQVWRRLATETAPLRLSHILRIARTERAVICLQLALLELVRLQAVLLRQERNFSDILLLKKSSVLLGS